LSKLKKYRSRGSIAGAALSGLCVYFAVLQTVPFLVWIALVPLFLVLGGQPRNASRYSGFLPGLIAGATFSVFAFAWMISGAHTFTGASVGYGMAIFLLCVVFFSLSCALLLWRTPLVLIAPVWILAEIAVQWGAEKMPWFLFHVGYALAGDLYAIQPVSVIGVTGAGFIVIVANYLIAMTILRLSWKYATAVLLLIGCYMLWGWWLLPPPLPDGKVAGRYDKRDPLLLIEQPWLDLQFPFLSSDGYSVEPGDNDLPLTTPYGKAGVLICNESALPGAAASRVRQGATFLLNMSNDGWFRNTWLVRQHFYNARLRAVETRRDIAINSNNGLSGYIGASGRIDTTGLLFTIHPNDQLTVAVRYPLIPVYICTLFVLSIIIINKKPSIL
jgi:apolipoprotein N-acyltransferase